MGSCFLELPTGIVERTRQFEVRLQLVSRTKNYSHLVIMPSRLDRLPRSARYYRTQVAFFLNFFNIRAEAVLLFLGGEGDEYCWWRPPLVAVSSSVAAGR